MPSRNRKSASDMFGKLLIVDDHPAILRLFERYFAREWHVFSAADGQEALHQLHSVVPDAIISDFEMPRLNGLELVHAVRSNSQLQCVPFFLITGSQVIEKDLQHTGVTKLVRKPFSLPELCLDIRKAVRPSYSGPIIVPGMPSFPEERGGSGVTN